MFSHVLYLHHQITSTDFCGAGHALEVGTRGTAPMGWERD